MADWRVSFTKTAVEDVREAAIYMREQLGAPSAALHFIDEVDKKVTLLKNRPKSFSLVRDFDLAKVGYRWCAVGNFLMFFTLDDETRYVFVERVLFGGRDWKALL